MIQFNKPYSIENGNDMVTFVEGKKGTITGTYNNASLTGALEGNILKATFHNSKVNAIGLIEITFHESGFNAKWKQGLEPGPMRGKCIGSLISDPSVEKNIKLDLNTGLDELRKIMEDLINKSKEDRIDFSNSLIKFVKENQEFLWLIPAYLRLLQSIEWQIDDGEMEGEIIGFFKKSEMVEEIPSRIFSKQCAVYDSRSGFFAWNDEDDKISLFDLILEDVDISLNDLILSYNAEYKSDEQITFIKFSNIIRTVLFASMVRAYYTEEHDYESIAFLITSPLEDQNIRDIESQTNGFGDAMAWAIDDVLYCLNIDVTDEEFDEDWGNYSVNYEKITEKIGDEESYDFPMITI